MGKIFCIMGKSCAGKDTIYKLLQRDEALNLKPVILYTTRPKRANEIDGVEYHFIDDKTLQQLELEGKLIEKREYQTVNGIWTYCTVHDEQFTLLEKNYIIIATLEAYKDIKEYFGQENVFPLYIELDDGIRLERALVRERAQETPNYNELCRRFLADNNDFSQDKLGKQDIKKSYNNEDLTKCVNNIKKDILDIIKDF